MSVWVSFGAGILSFLSPHSPPVPPICASRPGPRDLTAATGGVSTAQVMTARRPHARFSVVFVRWRQRPPGQPVSEHLTPLSRSQAG
jgi:cytochrome c biogenesis protein CcdA